MANPGGAPVKAHHQSKLRWEQFNTFIDYGAVEVGLSPAAA
jgi:hypothetical protein